MASRSGTDQHQSLTSYPSCRVKELVSIRGLLTFFFFLWFLPTECSQNGLKPRGAAKTRKGSFSCRCSWSSQGDRTILTILLPGPGVEVLRPVWQGWSQAYRLVSPRCTAWQPAPPRRRVHTARPRSAPLGYTPLVRSLGGGRRADDVRQER